MKKIKSIILLSFLMIILAMPMDSLAQEKKESKIVSDSIYVYGVCDMCKTRIENAALVGGVKKVSWNKRSQYLTVIYKRSKVDLAKIEEEVVKAGHDTMNKKAEDKSYNKLPGCCAYRSDEIEIH